MTELGLAIALAALALFFAQVCIAFAVNGLDELRNGKVVNALAYNVIAVLAIIPALLIGGLAVILWRGFLMGAGL